MKLSERKRKILRCVVADYIAEAQPVSSKSITEKYMKDISSATVRSELAGLEEMSFIYFSVMLLLETGCASAI